MKRATSSKQRVTKTREENTRTPRSLTCTNCRLRKTRCDGTQPRCKTCEVYDDACLYEKLPSMSKILAMATQIQEAEQTIADLRRQLEQRPGIPLSTTSTENDEASVSKPEMLAPLNARPLVSNSAPDTSSDEKLLSNLSLDANGKLCYYGPTSAVHSPINLRQKAASISEPNQDVNSTTNSRSLLTSNALQSRAWEEFAFGNAALQTDIPKDVLARLLQVHWTWVAPTFMWVYRPAFMRDMTTGGDFYSPFLLIVMCAHAARFDHQDAISEILLSRARLLLGEAIQGPTSIPTVQALLQLSARDLTHGSISKAWLYSGMAFRMSSDLGLNYSSGKVAALGNLSPEDLEVRRRLSWSCYCWDKIISLYLGRMPALPELPFDQYPELLDNSAENDPWVPHSGDTLNLSQMPAGHYPPTKSHMISCFENFCKLSVILNDIILSFYSRRGLKSPDDTLQMIQAKLDHWRENSPPHLKYTPENLPSTSPPLHIMSQNLLYYVALILLHRPFYSTPIHRASCRKAADDIEILLLLLEKTFGFSRITYLIAYCIYTGASVMIQDVKRGDLEATLKMESFLRALREGIKACPIVQRSLDIIMKGLKTESTTNNANSEESVSGEGFPRNYLPAFPTTDMSGAIDLPEVDNFTGMDLDGFSFLDCFPEDNLPSLPIS